MGFPVYPHADEVAALLLGSGCIKFAEKEPFQFTSGWLSPVYVNMRGILGPISLRQRLMVHAATCLRAGPVADEIDVVAGGETAGIPYAALLADSLGKDFAYVRKAPKEFGMKGRIEGGEVSGRRVLLVEDLTTEGSSKVGFVQSLRAAGAEVTSVFSAFWYGFAAQTEATLMPEVLTLYALCTWQDVLQLAEYQDLLSSEQIANVKAFIADPAGWADSPQR